MRRGWVFAVSLLAFTAVSLLTARAPAGQGAATYVGTEACKECHEDQYNAFQKNAHARAEADRQLMPGQVAGCESCHGPGSLHVAAAGDRSNPGFASIRNFKTMKPEDVSAVCTTCHRAGEQTYWDVSDHARGGIGCTNCHGIHTHAQETGPMLKVAGVNQLCLGCHREKRAQLARSAHMPLAEGSMDCASCHNPHGGPGPHQLRQASGTEVCLTCHADKRGPFLWEHAPVRENCMNCHTPHGSNNQKVLAAKLPFLCQRCHALTRHPSTLYDYPDLVSNRLINRSCTNCHSQIHGSNHPSGHLFLR